MATTQKTKPGYKTTEFWLTVIVTGCSLLWGAGVVDADSPATGADKVFGFVVSALAALGYTVSRGLAKQK